LEFLDDSAIARWFRGLPPAHGNALGGYAIAIIAVLAMRSPLHKWRAGDAELMSEVAADPFGSLRRDRKRPLGIARFGRFLAGYT